MYKGGREVKDLYQSMEGFHWLKDSIIALNVFDHHKYTIYKDAINVDDFDKVSTTKFFEIYLKDIYKNLFFLNESELLF
jgi:hypothetical protein